MVDTDQQKQHVVEDDNDSSNEEEASVHDSVQSDDPTIGSGETVNDDNDNEPNVINNDPPLQPKMFEDDGQRNNPVPAAVRQLQGNLDGPHCNRDIVGSVIHEHCIGSIIREYNNLEPVSVLVTTQYGFQKGMKVFKDEGCKATVKELSKNFIGKN